MSYKSEKVYLAFHSFGADSALMYILIEVIAIFALCGCRQSPQQTSATPSPSATPSSRGEKTAGNFNSVAVLDESYALAAKLGGKERPFYLVEHCKASVSVRPPAEAARYCREALRQAEVVADACERQKLKTKSIALLSEVSPVEALGELGKLPFVPCPLDHGKEGSHE